MKGPFAPNKRTTTATVLLSTTSRHRMAEGAFARQTGRLKVRFHSPIPKTGGDPDAPLSLTVTRCQPFFLACLPLHTRHTYLPT